jgi:hypothetical protein
MVIRPGVDAVRQSATRRDRLTSYAILMLTLILFVIAHGYQAWMGISAMEFLAPVWAKVIYAVYAIVNSAVTLTQAHIICRTTRFVLFTPLKASFQRLAEFSPREQTLMLFVTLGGQASFITIYLVYQ